MALQVAHLTKYYGSRAVVRDVSFRVADGELVTLLGPSGSGKSTVLRIIAGLTVADAGQVLVDDTDVTTLPPRARDLGFVFQNYALFEHLDVAGNVEFALRVRGIARAERQVRRDELLDLVGLGGSARKYPSQLSGGQRQRAALARALAHRPRLLLLDEPFGALDAQIRQELRHSLRGLLKQLATTAVFVTHDQEEAFSVADRILVLHRGRLLEQGAPARLYQAPQTEFVAGFVGRANLLPGEIGRNGVRLRLSASSAEEAVVPKRVKVLIRPEQLRLFADAAEARRRDGDLVSNRARVEQLEYLGGSQRVHLSVDSTEGTGRRYRLESIRLPDESARLPLQPGDLVTAIATQMHAISQPNLRLLVLARADAAGRRLLAQALLFAERTQALVTVVGDITRDPELAPSLDGYRQSFAGDLRLVDPGEQGLDLWAAAQRLIEGESPDLILVAESLREHGDALAGLLAQAGVNHVLLAAGEDNPLLPQATVQSWSLLLRSYSSSGADLALLAELAVLAGARVDVRDMGGLQRHGQIVERSAAALVLRSVAFSVAGLPRRTDEESDLGQPIPDELPPGLAIVDLGPRGGVGPRQQSLFKQFARRWLMLLVQPEAADLHLHTTPEFVPDAFADPESSPHARRPLPQAPSTALETLHGDRP